MRQKIHLIQLKNYPILEQLKLEEALLRTDDQNWCILNEGTPPAIVMGISGKVQELINSEYHSKNPVPIIKRFSGGGTVFVDHNTYFVTLICNENAVDVPCFPKPLMQWNANLYKSFLDERFTLKDNDYVMDNRKFGGNAQYIRKNRWLHHSSLLWDFNLENMNYLLMPPKIPAYRERRLHKDFLIPLKSFIQNRNELYPKILEQMEKYFSLSPMDLLSIVPILEKEHRKSTHTINMNFG